MIRKVLYLSYLVVAILISSSALSWGAERLTIGVAPHTSARIILEMYQPLRQHLEKSLNLPVEIVTAPDFTEFARRALQQQYDIAITTGHQARLLQTDAGYRPLLTYKDDFKALAVVRSDSGIHDSSALNGKQVAAQSPTSLVSLWGKHWLADNGIKVAQTRYVSASDSVAQLLLTGEVEVGFFSLANLQKLSRDRQQQLRVLAESKPILGRVYLLNKREAKLQKKLTNALWAFAASAEGKKYFATNSLGGYRAIKPAELKAMDRYAAEVRNVLKASDQ